MPAVQANDFSRQWDEIRSDVLAAVDRVGASGRLVLGEEVRRFEEEFAEWWGLPYAVGVASGLDALEISLRCAGIGAGDKVLTTPFTAFATTLAIIRAGARPVWSDVDETGGLDLEQAEDALQSVRGIVALVPVHLYGHPLDAGELMRLADRYDVRIIEDCAQSAGATRDGLPTGSAGVAAITSLYPTKNLGALGDGGVVLSADPELAACARRMRDYGQERKYQHSVLGLNSRLDELQAAILRSALLPRVDAWNARRREIAERYVDGLRDVSEQLRPITPTGGESAHHLFAIEVMTGEATAVAAELQDRGIGVNRHYPFLCPDQKAAEGRGEVFRSLSTAHRLSQRQLSLPIHPHLTDGEVDSVVDACRSVCQWAIR